MTQTSNDDTKFTEFTQAEATDEALLLITRKMRRMFPTEFAAAWVKLPNGAKDAIGRAEARADVVRDRGGKVWPRTLDDEIEG